MAKTDNRPINLCRSWLFVNGADEQALNAAPSSGADVLIQELEDFTPPHLRPKARALSPDILASWRATGAMTAVRVNPLDGDGMDDLRAVMRGAPDIVALPKTASPAHVKALDAAVSTFENDYGLPNGQTLLLPNIETAAGLVRTMEIATASPRVAGCLLASEDLAADLGAERTKQGTELAYCRQRFLVECIAAGTHAVDCPYTWQDTNGAQSGAEWARHLGYRAKSAVAHDHAAIINSVFTPSEEEVEHAKRIITAFEDAQAHGAGRVELDGSLVETPIYQNARRLVSRALQLDEIKQ